MSLRHLSFSIASIGIILASSAYAISYPTTTPIWETPGGTYRTYFDNMFTSEFNCFGSGKVVWWFNAVWVPFCVVPAPVGLNILWSQTGDTLRYNGIDWVRNNLLFNNGTAIGIGRTNPSYILDVLWTANFSALRMPTGAGSWRVLTSDSSGNMFWSNSISWATASGIIWWTQNYVPKFWLAGNWLVLSQVYDNGTNVGIGNTSPSFKLDIAWTTRVWWTLVVATGTDNVMNFQTTDNNWLYTQWLTSTWSRRAWMGLDMNLGSFNINVENGANKILFNGGNVGIGTTNPTALLEIAGQVKITGGSPWVWKILTSDAGGLATWSNAFSGTTSASGIVWWAQNYISKFGVWGNGLINSQVFDNGVNVGIGTSTPWARLDVAELTANWAFKTVLARQAEWNSSWTGTSLGVRSWWTQPSAFSGKMFSLEWSFYDLVNTSINFYRWWSTTWGFITFATDNNTERMIINTAGNVGIWTLNPWAKLEVNGQVKITGGSPASGKFLQSDATGLATWQNVTASTVTATGITGWTEWYIPRFWTGGNGLYSSIIYQNGNRIGIGTGVLYPGFTINLDSWVNNTTWIRFARVNSSSPLFTAWPTIPVWVNGSGELVPVQWGMIPVYTALWATPNAAVNVSVDPPTIGANYDRYFTIPARQSFTVTDVGGNPYNCPEFQIGSTNKWATWCNQTPYASYVMTAQNATVGDRYAYQILISDRTDAPFVVRWGMYSNANGTLMNTAMTIPALWFKAITVPTNRSNWFYINPWVDQNNNPIAGWGNVGIWTVTPSTNLHVSGATLITGDLTVQWRVITDTIVNRTVTNVSISWSLLPDNAAPLAYRNIGAPSQRWNNLYLSGQISIWWGSPWAWKILTSDASGLASWSTGFSGATSASGITWGTQNYIPKFWTWWNWLISSQVFDNGTNIWVWITSWLSAKLTIDSWIADDSGLRLARLNPSSPLTANGVIALWVDGSGKVLPISPISNIAVYTAVDRVTTLNPNPDLNTFNITYDFNRYFAIPGKQSFVVSNGSSASYNGPYFKENWTDALCSINGTYGTSAYNCEDPDPATGISASPYNSFTMTAKGDVFGYQIALGARWDAPLFARSGRYNGSQTWWLYTNDSPYQTPAPWQKVISVPANHPEYLFINTGLNSQLQAISGGGNVGIGTTTPQSRFEVWTGATTTSLIHFRWSNNVWVWLGASRTAQTGNANSAFGNESLYSVTNGYSNTAMGYRSLRTTTTGYNNSAFWQEALYSNAWWTWNTALWYQALYSNTSWARNIGIWPQALNNLTTGNDNIAIGYQAARVIAGSSVSNNIAIWTNTLNSATVWNLIAVGYQALYSNAWGAGNQWVGHQALYSNTSGNYNVANWYEALLLNSTASNNIAIGYQASRTNSTSSNNTAVWFQSLYANTAASNTAMGSYSLRSNTTGWSNTAFWQEALYGNTTWANNVAVGLQTLDSNSTWWENVAVWKGAMGNIGSAPQNNTMLGTNAGYGWWTNSSYNTMIGHSAWVAINGWNGNTFLWYTAWSAVTTGSNNIAIWSGAQLASNTASNQMSIGNWIYGNGGNIWVGTNAPSTKLDINGQVRIRGGAPGAGKVLMSDATGVATWQTPTGAAAIPWSISGNSTTDPATNFVGTLDNVWLSFRTNNTEWMRLLTNGNLGLGTTGAAAKLDVNGTSIFRNTMTMTSNQNINFQSPGVWSTSPGGFNWLLATDTAGMYAVERWSDQTDYTFKMGDNATDDGDRYVFWQTSWNGIASDRWPLIMNGTWAAFDPRFTGNTSNWTMQDATMYMNYTNRNVGIFTNSPDASTKLDVNGQVRIRGWNPGIGKILVSDANGVATWQTAATGSFAGWWILGNAGTNPTTNFMGSTDNVDVVFRTNGTEKMRIQAGGNVGIGTNNPGAKLYINGGDIRLADTAWATSFAIKSFNNASSLWFMGAANPSLILSDSHDWDRSLAIQYNAWTSGQTGWVLNIGQLQKNGSNFTHGITSLFTAWAERVRINASGNVGIGTTAPGARLEVNGQVKITGGSPAAGKFSYFRWYVTCNMGISYSLSCLRFYKLYNKMDFCKYTLIWCYVW